MGDRGNIKLVGELNFPREAYLYTHWGGSDMKQILAEALEKSRSRWDDGSYLARVIFQTLIGKDDGVTGFGLSTEPGDNEHPFLVVDVDANQVWEEPDMRDSFAIKLRPDSIKTPVTFQAFIDSVNADKNGGTR